MCGRFAFFSPEEAIAAAFGLDGLGELPPRFNIAPTQDVFTVRIKAGRMVAEQLRWGLVPFWAKDPAIGTKLINARAETLAEKPSFRQALRRRRCLIPASGFYEWVRQGSGKQPWFISPADAEFICFAGLWEEWRDPDQQLLRTCTIVTTVATPFMARLHQRMPVILPPDAYGTWLNPEAPGDDTDRLLAAAPPVDLQAWPVSRKVNSPMIQGEALIQPIEEVG